MSKNCSPIVFARRTIGQIMSKYMTLRKSRFKRDVVNTCEIRCSYPGGEGSFCAAVRMKEIVDPNDITLVFCDTKIEHPDLYRFLDESATALNLPLIKLADGRNPWEVFRDVKFQGNSRIAQCSRILKRETMQKYLVTLPEKPTIVLGIDYEEEHRLKEARKNNAGYRVIAPLCDPPYLSRLARREMLQNYNLERPVLYKRGFPHNNCGGFCVKAGLAQFKLLLETDRARYLWHEGQQETLVRENPSLNKPFLRKTINGALTLRQYREMLESGAGLSGEEQFEFFGCGCFI
jgi:3'-phosphoadenosine 5'-phosphosulfate sulfotransferase (PAPS reductase)/FAD synthetase